MSRSLLPFILVLLATASCFGFTNRALQKVLHSQEVGIQLHHSQDAEVHHSQEAGIQVHHYRSPSSMFTIDAQPYIFFLPVYVLSGNSYDVLPGHGIETRRQTSTPIGMVPIQQLVQEFT